jgi:hypothetical protein
MQRGNQPYFTDIKHGSPMSTVMVEPPRNLRRHPRASPLPDTSVTAVWLGSIVAFCLISLWRTSHYLPAGRKDSASFWSIGSSREQNQAMIIQPTRALPGEPIQAMIIQPTRALPGEPIRIAHVISLITCKKASRVKGFLDALVVLRHSIHQNSVHATTRSKYSYQMYAVVHPDGGCDQHVPLLRRLGYTPIVRQTPVNITEITEDSWYRKHVESENCCGSKEFIKLYAYTLTEHPIVVHWDLDVAVLQPLDDLFDAMLYDKSSPQGKTARQRLQLQHKQVPLPDRIDAFFTRDVTSAAPWETVQAVQGGFLVARPSVKHFEMFQALIKEANYTAGRGPQSGWGGMVSEGWKGVTKPTSQQLT